MELIQTCRRRKGEKHSAVIELLYSSQFLTTTELRNILQFIDKSKHISNLLITLLIRTRNHNSDVRLKGAKECNKLNLKWASSFDFLVPRCSRANKHSLRAIGVSMFLRQYRRLKREHTSGFLNNIR
jgi:hypothetical protein